MKNNEIAKYGKILILTFVVGVIINYVSLYKKHNKENNQRSPASEYTQDEKYLEKTKMPIEVPIVN